MTRRLPPEWAPQDGVLLTWPHPRTDWADQLPAVERTYVEIALTICRHERLLIVAFDAIHADEISKQLLSAGLSPAQFQFALAPSNDTWTRDHGPITVLQSNQPVLLNFQFNGWGNKYECNLDNAITSTLCHQGLFGGTRSEPVDLVLEGGSIESDGEGSLLLTESCLLAPDRNSCLSKSALETKFRDLLGTQRCLWLDVDPLRGDDIDGHIDTLARFCDSRSIAYVQCPDAGDEHFESMSRLEAQLQALRTPDGKVYRLVPLPWPAAKYGRDGQRLPATYANFLIINGAVLVPTYGDAADAVALATLARCFPDRGIVGIDCSTLIQQNGSLHCITMQLPAGVLNTTTALE